MTTLNLIVGNTNDDAQQLGNGSPAISAFSAYSATNPLSTVYRACAARFTGLTGVAGTTINSATFSGYVFSTGNDDINAQVYVEAADSPVNFATNTNIISRARTTAFVSWVQDSLGVGYKSPADISAPVQEWASRPGAGTVLAVLVIPNSNNLKGCDFRDYSGNSAQAAKIDIDFSPAPDPAEGSGSITAAGSLAGTGYAAAAGSGSISGSDAVVGVGYAAASGQGAIAANSALAATGYATASGSAGITAVGTLTAAGYAAAEGSGSVSGSGTLSGTGAVPDGPKLTIYCEAACLFDGVDAVGVFAGGAEAVCLYDGVDAAEVQPA